MIVGCLMRWLGCWRLEIGCDYLRWITVGDRLLGKFTWWTYWVKVGVRVGFFSGTRPCVQLHNVPGVEACLVRMFLCHFREDVDEFREPNIFRRKGLLQWHGNEVRSVIHTCEVVGGYSTSTLTTRIILTTERTTLCRIFVRFFSSFFLWVGFGGWVGSLWGFGGGCWGGWVHPFGGGGGRY